MVTTADTLVQRAAAFEQSIGCTFSRDHRDRLCKIAERYYPTRFLDMPMDQVEWDLDLQEPLRPAVRRRWLKVIAKHAETLRAVMAFDDGETDLTRERIVAGLLPFSERAALQKALTRLANKARELSKAAKDRGGRQGDLWTREIVDRLIPLYRDITGKEPKRQIDKKTHKPKGPLFDFIKGFFVSFAPSHKLSPTDGAIDEAIRHYLSPRQH